MATIKKRTWEILEAAEPNDSLSKIFDIFILLLIFTNVLAVIFGTVQSIAIQYGKILELFEMFSVIVFSVEYLGRIWSCTTSPKYKRPVKGRIKQVTEFMSIIDLLAILPFYLPFIGLDLRVVRIFRMFRLARIAKVSRYYSSLNLMLAVIRNKKEEMLLTTALMLMLLIMSASAMYYCEHDAQPEQFPSIPSALWWSAVTLTTVGYGDVFPITIAGKITAAIIAILGIGMFALPTGILGAGFVDEIQKRKSSSIKCPHCGKKI